MTATAPKRGKGRPPEGERVEVRLPPDVIAAFDEHAAANGLKGRAPLLRAVLVVAARRGIDVTLNQDAQRLLGREGT